MTHPHDPLIRAWMAGDTAQYLEDGVWRDIEPYATCDKLPHFYITGAYRLKPVTYRFRVGETRHVGLLIAVSLEDETRVAKRDDFLGWLTDWQDVTR